MADTFTTNYNLTKPEVGASTDTWGTKINLDLDTIDATLKSIADSVTSSVNSEAALARNADNLTSGTVPPGRLSGTYGISISGNAATATSAGSVTNGVYTTGDQTIGGAKTFTGLLTINNNLRVGNGQTSSNIFMADSDEGERVIHCNSNQIGFLTQAGGWGAYCDDNGNWTAVGNVTAYSDERLKTGWADLAEDFVDQLADVKVGTYTRTDSGDRQLGVSAQSLRPVAPEAVLGDETLSVAYGNAALAACVMLARRVKQLEAKLGA